MKHLAFIFLTLLIINSNTQVVSEADFVLGSTYTGSILWDSFIGISVDFQNIQNLMNTSLYQAYHLNSNLKGDWTNNFAVSLKTPLGHKYNCSSLKVDQPGVNVTCSFQTQGNSTYWQVLGNFVYNTMDQPYWCMGYDMQGVNLTLVSHQDVFYNWLFKVYTSTYNYMFCAQIVDYGDKMVSRGYKESYTPENFLSDIEMANYVVYQVGHSGPGITQDASSKWLVALQNYMTVNFAGHYTVRCIVFKDPSKLNIQSLLSDNSSKYYLQNRFLVNQTYGYTDFSQLYLGINDIKITTGDGVDGITNSFAAALWVVDIAMEFCLMNGWQIDFNHEIRNGNFQSVLGPEPDLKPSALYYGLIFAVLVRDGSPQILLPSTKSYISSKIKVFGFSNGQTFKVLLINKDTNTSLNGTVLIKSQLTSDLKCIYMEAPSLSSKDGITIAGYNFVGGSAAVNGTFKQISVKYSYADSGYQVPIKYAQAAICQTADSKFAWPTGKKQSSQKHLQAIFLVALLLMFLSL